MAVAKRQLRSSTKRNAPQHVRQADESYEGLEKLRKAVKLDDGIAKDENSSSEPRYFLMKAEPESRFEKGRDVKFSIDDLKTLGTDSWEGVRNGEACKTMRERMKLGDLAFFYHSNTKYPGIAGIVSISTEGYPDASAWDSSHRSLPLAYQYTTDHDTAYYDPKSDEKRPRWYRVDVKYERHMKRFIGLHELRKRQDPELASMQLLRRPQLSVQRVSPAEWAHILRLENYDLTDPMSVSSLKAGEEIHLDREESQKAQAEIIASHGG